MFIDKNQENPLHVNTPMAIAYWLGRHPLKQDFMAAVPSTMHSYGVVHIQGDKQLKPHNAEGGNIVREGHEGREDLYKRR